MSTLTDRVTVMLADGTPDGSVVVADPTPFIVGAIAIVGSGVGATPYKVIGANANGSPILGSITTFLPANLLKWPAGTRIELPAQPLSGSAGTSADAANAAAVAGLQLKTKYVLAVAGKVHMLADTTVLVALAGGSLQGVANTQANALQALLSAHMLEVGTSTADGAHLVADTTNNTTLTAVPVASGLATCITLINALKAAINAHETQAGVHFHNDTTTALSLSVDPPVTLADCVTDLNDLLTYISNHFARASF